MRRQAAAAATMMSVDGDLSRRQHPPRCPAIFHSAARG
jgi:hypothetical protein